MYTKYQQSDLKYEQGGVPTVTQWVENLTVAAWFTAEMQDRFLVQHSGLKDPLLSQLQLGFTLRPGTSTSCGWKPCERMQHPYGTARSQSREVRRKADPEAGISEDQFESGRLGKGLKQKNILTVLVLYLPYLPPALHHPPQPENAQKRLGTPADFNSPRKC